MNIVRRFCKAWNGGCDHSKWLAPRRSKKGLRGIRLHRSVRVESIAVDEGVWESVKKVETRGSQKGGHAGRSPACVQALNVCNVLVAITEIARAGVLDEGHPNISLVLGKCPHADPPLFDATFFADQPPGTHVCAFYGIYFSSNCKKCNPTLLYHFIHSGFIPLSRYLFCFFAI
jgi:hypothetical protein